MRYLLNKPINLNRHRTSFEDVPELHPLVLINLLRRLGLEVWDCVSSCNESGCHRFWGISASNSIDIKTAVHRISLHVKLCICTYSTFITILIDITVLSHLVAHFDRALVPGLCRDTRHRFEPRAARECVSVPNILDCKSSIYLDLE